MELQQKEKSDSIIRQWHMDFQVLDLKEKQFLNLLDDDLTDTKPLYTEGNHRLDISVTPICYMLKL